MYIANFVMIVLFSEHIKSIHFNILICTCTVCVYMCSDVKVASSCDSVVLSNMVPISTNSLHDAALYTHAYVQGKCIHTP